MSRACPLQAGLLAALVLAFPLAWGASSAVATLTSPPADRVYVIEPWPANLTPLAGSCSHPLIVAASADPLHPRAVVYDASRGWLLLEGFQARAACAGEGFAAVAGYWRWGPALAVINVDSGAALVYSVENARYTSFSAVDCGGGEVVTAGTGPEGIVVLAAGPQGARAMRLRFAAPITSVSRIDGSIYITTPLGVVVVNSTGAYALEPRGLLANSSIERIVEGPRARPWMAGMAGPVNGSYWALLAPLEGGEAMLLRSRGHGGLILDANWLGSYWIAYYRPGSFWDSLVQAGPTGVAGAEILWSGSHEVDYVKLEDGRAATLALSHTTNASSLVLSCIGSLVPAHFWLGVRPVMHIASIPSPEALEARVVPVPSPLQHPIKAEALGVGEESLAPAIGRLPPARVERARLAWSGPLLAFTYAALAIVWVSLAWRGFWGCAV